ncbi:hypothetical protein ACFVT5_13235 [Streptomyces sp. NPDC058001]|uniref:hypothetical protein n=1 Tax=Streptomyces sp. NPDC058001 TaxID=3346300 RepID=UPI0036ECB04B
MPVRNTALRPAVRRLLASVSCAGFLLAGCSGAPWSGAGTLSATPSHPPAPQGHAGPPQGHAGPEAQSGRAAGDKHPLGIHGIGPATRARIPDTTRQVLVVTGEGKDANTGSVVLHQRGANGTWGAVGGPWPAHNAMKGWTHDHRADDQRSPIGVFGLRDSGGRLPDPGTKLPYSQDKEFADSGTGFLGESLEGSFEYVIAIDYNRVPGASPLDKRRPLGEGKGGGIWLHVDHGGPTRACVSLPLDDMRELLLLLDPKLRPVVVMGDKKSLTR